MKMPSIGPKQPKMGGNPKMPKTGGAPKMGGSVKGGMPKIKTSKGIGKPKGMPKI